MRRFNVNQNTPNSRLFESWWKIVCHVTAEAVCCVSSSGSGIMAGWSWD
jgi:hypothetical protein